MKLKGLNILLISNEPWGDVWYSKHNYAHELSKHNHVTFVGPSPAWRPRFLLGCHVSEESVAEGLTVLHYNNVLPAKPGCSYHRNNALVSAAIRRHLQKRGRPTDLFISFDPARLYDPQALGAKTSLFIAVDKYFFSLPGERHLYSKVDGIVTISRTFNDLYLPFRKPILTIGHGISSDEFSATPAETVHEGFGLYIGGIDKRLDLDLVEHLVKSFPDVPFVFIGRFALQGDPRAEALFMQGRHKNLHHLGVKPFKDLKRWIAASRFCLAPMDITHPGNDISHHKVFQYLAFGKPVFSTVFSEYTGIADLLYMDNYPQALAAKLARFLQASEDPELRAARIAHMKGQTYEGILQRLEAFLEQEVRPGKERA